MRRARGGSPPPAPDRGRRRGSGSHGGPWPDCNDARPSGQRGGRSGSSHRCNARRSRRGWQQRLVDLPCEGAAATRSPGPEPAAAHREDPVARADDGATPLAGSAAEAGRAAGRLAEAIDDRPSAELVPPTGTVAAPVVVARAREAEVVAASALAGFIVLFGLVRAGRTQAVDLAISLRVQGRSHPTVAALMAAASWPGFPPQSRVIPPVLILGLLAARLRLEAATLLAGWGAAAVSTAVKAGVGRQRPDVASGLRVVTAPLGGSSFPSGHVLTFVGVYGTSAYLANSVIRPTVARRAVVGGLLGLVGLV